MSDAKNITYLLGAGASYNACPILNELGDKMIELAKMFFKDPEIDFLTLKPIQNIDIESIIQDIGYFGLKSLKFVTIDTYARKLYLNSNNSELSRLKMAISCFFTIWQHIDNLQLKSRETSKFEDIDHRYISLLASILNKGEDFSNVQTRQNIYINSNIKFVTWNYDLQLEFAFKNYYNDSIDWKEISKRLKFRNDGKVQENLDICHLNGYHGHYLCEHPNSEETHEINTLENIKSSNINEILEIIVKEFEYRQGGQVTVNNHISYAWENNPISEKIRN